MFTNCISSAKPSGDPTRSSSEWRSNPAYAKRLAPAVKVDVYYISPPLGFTLQKKHLRSDVSITDQYDWRGPAGADGTKPRLTIAIFKMLPGVINQKDAGEWLESGLEAMNTREKHYVHTGAEDGKVGGMSFARAYWKRDPNDPNEGRRFHGFQYQYSQSTTSISIIGDDIEPHYKSTLDLMEAAALTFHK